MSRVLVLLVPDEELAWDLFDWASELKGVERALMVNLDHPHSVASLFSEDER